VRTFTQFDPKVSGLIIFKSKHGSDRALFDILQKNVWGKDGTKMDLTQREGWTIIEISKDLTNENQKFVSISPDLYKLKADEIKPVITKARELVQQFIAEGSRISTVGLYTCGTRDSAWLRNYSDVTFLYKDGSSNETGMENLTGETYQSNVA
jgi:2-phospho-L-lactate guanylyltransferase (CobY/MobA/RfbA family)